jgi:hypothetical protein
VAEGALPNLFLIGAAKSGTSSLHYYLGLHPEVAMSKLKEPQFFIYKDGFDPSPYIHEPREERLFGMPSTWPQGLDWYRTLFDPTAPVRGESSVAYTYPWYTDTADRLASVVSDARFIYVVRDPVERIVSHYLMYFEGGREWRPIEEALAGPNNLYLALTRYASALDPYIERFGRDRIHIVRQDALLRDRRATMSEIFTFLGVDPEFFSSQMEYRRNRSATKGRAYQAAERFRRTRLGRPLVRHLPSGIKARIEQSLAAPSGGGEKRPAMPTRLEARIRSELESEIARLEELTGWDLHPWRTGGVPPVRAADGASEA